MKKMVLIVVGCVVLITMGIVIRITNIEHGMSNSEGDKSGMADVSQASRLPGADESIRDGSGTGQDPALRGSTIGQTGAKHSGGTTDHSSPRLSEAVKALLGEDGKKHNYSSLLKAINELDADMSPADVAALREMLNFPNDRFPEKMRPIEINAVKNDVLDKLLRQKELPEGLGLQLVEMAGNAENDPVWRDYCIQFMQPFYERVAGGSAGHGAGSHVEQAFQPAHREGGQAGKPAPQNELSVIHDAMFSALDERDATLAGTALIGLELLSRTHDEFDRELIVETATEIAGDEMASSASRLTALRLSAQISREAIISKGNSDEETIHDEQGMSNDKVVQAARSLAQTGETVLLRSAAIVTLGKVGTKADRELLESYAADDNRQIAAAAKMALEKMDQDPSVEPVVVDVASQTSLEPQVTEKLPPVLINQDI